MPQRVKEEDRTEKIIRSLLKLPENKRCINCNSLGPQYVCTTFWTFVCTSCSGVHREFTHRVKSVSMAKFNAEEVNALQAGGNERARQIYFKEWDMQRNSLPDGSNLHRLRDFIKHVYVDRKYTGQRSHDKLPMIKAGTTDDFHERHSFERSSHGARDDFFERRSFERPIPGNKDNVHERRSFDKSSPRSDERNLRYYMDERRSPRYKQENVRPANRRNRPARFEIVDDRFRDDESKGVRRFESNRYMNAEARSESKSPQAQRNSKEMRSPPAIRPVKEILGENVPPLRVGEPQKANGGRDADGSTYVQKTASSSSPGSIEGKAKESKVVIPSSLIDFDADGEAPATSAALETQGTGPASSTLTNYQSSTTEKAPHAPNVNSVESLLFELSPSVIETAARTSGEDVQINATETSLNHAEATFQNGSTSNASIVSTEVGDSSISPVENAPASARTSSYSTVNATDMLALPSVQQNQPPAAPVGNNNFTAQQSNASLEALYNQQLNLSPAPNCQGPPTNSSTEQTSKGASNQPQDNSSRDGSKFGGRKELPAELFVSSYSPFAAASPGWQFRPPHGAAYPMQYHPVAMAVAAFSNPAQTRNPFDTSEVAHVQAPQFPSMSSLQGVIPNMSAQTGIQPQPSMYALAPPPQAPSYGMMMPPGTFMGQQSLNMTLSRAPENNSSSSSSGEDAFGSLNPIQPPTGPYPAPAAPSSFSATGGNPFG